ncbi:MAG: hypothetical protein ABI598_05490 [Chloroflexota bacterium]
MRYLPSRNSGGSIGRLARVRAATRVPVEFLHAHVWGRVLRAARLPIVLFAFAVDRIRRLPGARIAGRSVTLVVRALFLIAGILLIAWMAEKTPQKISIADLEAGKLSPMQSWIILSGELTDGPPTALGWYSYRLTDPDLPGPSMLVRSPVQLSLGKATISGFVDGGRDTSSGTGFAWVGSMAADATLAHEIPPPWGAATVVLAALLIIAARRTTYPMFFRGRPRHAPPAIGTTPVGVYRTLDLPVRPPVRAGIVSDRSGMPAVSLLLPGAPEVPMRLHSTLTGISAGEFMDLSVSRPVLRWRQPAEDLLLSFASPSARDAVYAALVADAAGRGLRPALGRLDPAQEAGGTDGR